MKRILASCAAFAMTCAVFAAYAMPLAVSAETTEVDENGYDLSGFGKNFPEVFSKDDTVISTADSYKSHDLCINMSKYVSPYLSGDLTGDHSVTLQDAVLLCKYLAEDTSITVFEAGVHNADCNVSGQIDVKDMRAMLSYLAGTMTAENFFVESSVVYHIADIYIRDVNSFRSGFAKDVFPPKGSAQLMYADKYAQKIGVAKVLINADYVECRESEIIYRNGVHYRDIPYRDDVCILYDDGVMDIVTVAEYQAMTDEQKSHIWQTSNFSVGLVKDGVAQNFSRSTNTNSLSTCHPRSSMGYYEPGHYVFIQVDGRQAGYSAGMYLDELVQLYMDLGVKEAQNLDGGSSSSLVFNNEFYNTPAPVHVGDTQLGRATSDFFFICEPSEIPVDTAAEAWGDNPPET